MARQTFAGSGWMKSADGRRLTMRVAFAAARVCFVLCSMAQPPSQAATMAAAPAAASGSHMGCKPILVLTPRTALDRPAALQRSSAGGAVEGATRRETLAIIRQASMHPERARRPHLQTSVSLPQPLVGASRMALRACALVTLVVCAAAVHPSFWPGILRHRCLCNEEVYGWHQQDFQCRLR